MIDEELFRSAAKNLMDLFVTPEVTKRQDEGALSKPLRLSAWQIIFYPDGRVPEVRINEEVRALGKMKLKEGQSKEPGDPVYFDDMDEMSGLLLVPDDDQDAAHATMIRMGDTWVFAFDFVYNKSLANSHVEAATEFLEAANSSLAKTHWSAFVDCLFSAAELASKAILLCLYSDPRFRESSSHGAIHSRINRFAHLGNIDSDQVHAFNQLSNLRGPARYLTREIALSKDDAQKMYSSVQELIYHARALAGDHL